MPATTTLADALEFVRRGDVVAFRIPLAESSRLLGLFGAVEGTGFDIDVCGGSDARGRLCLLLRASGAAQLTCQRCLEPMAYRVELAVELRLVRSMTELDADPQDSDAILADAPVDLCALAEQEIELSLPIAPAHATCALPGPAALKPANADWRTTLAALRDKSG